MFDQEVLDVYGIRTPRHVITSILAPLKQNEFDHKDARFKVDMVEETKQGLEALIRKFTNISKKIKGKLPTDDEVEKKLNEWFRDMIDTSFQGQTSKVASETINIKATKNFLLYSLLYAWFNKIVRSLGSVYGGRSPYPATSGGALGAPVQTKFRQFANRFGDSSDGDETDPDDFDM
jgi:cytochrome c556